MRRYIFILEKHGIYSEVNNLLLAEVYARHKGGELRIDSRGWGARFDAGWHDYFCTGRAAGPGAPSLWNGREGRVSLRWRLTRGWLTAVMPDFWWTLRSPAFWSSALKLPDDEAVTEALYRLKRDAAERLYGFNHETREAVEALCGTLALPERYGAIHIRRGDKVTSGEMSPLPLDAYLEHLDFLGCNHLFVATDDYAALKELASALPAGFHLYSFSSPGDSGHDQSQFNASSPEVRKRETLRMFAEMELMCGAQRLICSFSSNVGRFAALRLGLERCRSVDIAWHPY